MTSQLLAGTFTIVFGGLMTFVGPSATEKKHVAVVNDSVAHGDPHVQLNSIRQFDLLDGDTLTFDLPAGTAATDTTFDNRVPTLSDYITAGDVHDDVKDETHPNKGVLAFVELPAGTLYGAGAFNVPATFTDKNGVATMRCPAANVRFKTDSAQTSATLTVLGKDGKERKKLSFAPGDILLISNMSSVTGVHFHEYTRLMKKNSMLGTVVQVMDGHGCAQDGTITTVQIPKLTIDPSKPLVEILQKYPRLSLLELFGAFKNPGGDCGPTDYP